MKKLIRVLVILAVIGGVAFGIWYLLNRRASSQAQLIDVIRSEVVERGTLVLSVPASGQISANQDRFLSLALPAMVTEVNVDVGDRVKQGTILARVDTQSLEFSIQQSELALQLSEIGLEALSTDVDERDIELADLAIQEASVALQSANASITLAEAQAAQSNDFAEEALDATQTAYDRTTEVIDRIGLPEVAAAPVTASLMEAEGNVGITEFRGAYSIEQARSQWRAAYQAYIDAQNRKEKLLETTDDDQIRQQELNIEQARLDLQSTKDSLKNATLVAPFDGIIALNDLVEGNFAVPGKPQIRLLDDSIFFVDVNIDEIDISSVTLGQAVDVTLDAYPDITIIGTIASISSVPNNLSGIVGYAVRVELTNAEPSMVVRQGMTANVVIETGRIEDVLLVPNWAIRTDQDTGDAFVYVDRQGDITKQVVTTGEYRNDIYSVIVSGLNENDTVVLVAEERTFEFSGPPSGF